MITTPANTRRRNAFTLVEVLVALGILVIMLVIIVVPLRLGFDTFHVGKARADTQGALQSTMTSMENDLRQAVYVFPNRSIQNVTASTTAPYHGYKPYFVAIDPATPNAQVCSGNAKIRQWANPSRIDMIQVRRNSQGDVVTPLKPSYNVVTYYARRQDTTQNYDPIDNPLVMFRAEYPAYGIYEDSAASPPVGPAERPFPAPEFGAPAGSLNAEIAFDRFDVSSSSTPSSCSSNAAVTNRNAQWLTHNIYGEANLEPLTKVATMPTNFETTDDALYSHALATPRGLALEASHAYLALDPAFIPGTEAPLVPDTSFTETDTNGDGKIDRVTISLGLASFDVGAQGSLKNNQPTGTRLRATRTIDLPNVQ